MELVVPSDKANGKDAFEMLEAGTHDAMCIDVIYPVVTRYQNEPPKNTVVFVYEVNKKRTLKDGGGEDEFNHHIWSNNFTLTLHPKGKLKPMLEMWTGETLSEGTKTNLEDFVGKPAKLTVVHKNKITKPGEKKLDIVAVMPSDLEFATQEGYERKNPDEIGSAAAAADNNVPF